MKRTTSAPMKTLVAGIRHASRNWLPLVAGSCALLTACSQQPAATAPSPSPAATPATVSPAAAKLGIRPTGDETVAIDMSRIHSDELKQIYAYIDEHLDEHVMNLQRWIQQPSISNTGEGIQESAEMVKGFFDQLQLPSWQFVGCELKVQLLLVASACCCCLFLPVVCGTVGSL